MREQSSSNITHTHKVFRGGETKVMKKSLLSLLIFALVFTMAAPAFAATGAAVKLSDISNSYAKEEIEALVEAGIIGGYADGTFKPANSITRAEFAKILALVLDLEEDAAAASVFTDVPAWAKGYVGALVNAELTTGVTATTYGSNQNISREQLATFFVRAWDLEEAAEEVNLTPKFNDADKVAPYAKANVALAGEIGFINGLPNGNFDPKGNAQRQAVARLAYEFYVNGEEYLAEAEKVIKDNEPAPDYATKVEKVFADNLIQVKVEFDGAVESQTASDSDNYTVEGIYDPKVKSAKVVDETTVVLTLDKAMKNQEEYLLTFNNVRSADTSKVLSVTDHAFKPVDSTLPFVESVEALGNKTLRIKFNEPIKAATNTNFKVDDKTVLGSINIVNETVVIKLNSTLADGDYTLTVEGVTDYADFKSLKNDYEFTVVQDNEAPTISEVVTATFEYVTLKFSEPVDPDTVIASNIYWLQGSTKRYAESVSQLSDDTFRFNFNSSNRLQYATELHVTGVKDYSGNTIASGTTVEVTPVLDQTRPEVVSVKVDSSTELKVKFNKNLESTSAEKSGNYVVKDADGKEVSKLKTVTLGSDNKTVNIRLASALGSGKTYTIEISGVSDNTTLKNVMVPYSTQLNVSDKVNPEVNEVTRNFEGNNNYLVVSYSKMIAQDGDGSAVERSKYMAYYTDKDGKTSFVNLPSSTSLNVTGDGKSVYIYFPTSFDVRDISKLRISAVKDTVGNWVDPITDDYAVTDADSPILVTSSVYATDNNKISVDFDKSILGSTVTASDFEVRTSASKLTVTSATLSSTNSQRVILTLSENSKLTDDAKFNSGSVTVSLVANPRTQSPAGIAISGGTATVQDQISGTIKEVLTGTPAGDQFEIVFTEALKETGLDSNAKTDLVIKNSKGIISSNDYNISVSGDTITVTFVAGKEQSGVLSVELANPRFLQDAAGNVLKGSSEHQFEIGR